MTSNGNAVSPVSPGQTTSSASLALEEPIPHGDRYIPEIAIIAVAICFLMAFFFVLFPKKSETR
jgi:hypothetical protein